MHIWQFTCTAYRNTLHTEAATAHDTLQACNTSCLVSTHAWRTTQKLQQDTAHCRLARVRIWQHTCTAYRNTLQQAQACKSSYLAAHMHGIQKYAATGRKRIRTRGTISEEGAARHNTHSRLARVHILAAHIHGMQKDAATGRKIIFVRGAALSAHLVEPSAAQHSVFKVNQNEQHIRKQSEAQHVGFDAWRLRSSKFERPVAPEQPI